MKSIIISIIIISIIISLGIYEQVFMTDTLTTLTEMGENILDDIYNEDFQSAKKKCDDLKSLWDSKKLILELLFSHNEFKDVPTHISELNANIVMEDKLQSSVRANILIDDIKTHLSILKYSIENVL